jgi:hypothetical protein
MCVCIYIYSAHVCVYIYMYVCMYVYIYMYVCMLVRYCYQSRYSCVSAIQKHPFADFVLFGYAELQISVMPIALVSVFENFIAQNERPGIQRSLNVKDPSPLNGTTAQIGRRPTHF